MDHRFSRFLLFFITFLNYCGFGLIFPLFASLMFDRDLSFFPIDTSETIRGFWMGILISLSPLTQFFAAPILGKLSDKKGRKPMLLFGLTMGGFAYALGMWGVLKASLGALVIYRLCFGFCMATTSVVQAALVDLSTKETKLKNFGFYNGAFGLGFMFGPYLAGKLSDPTLFSWFNYSTPFLLGFCLTTCNLLCLYFNFKETRPKKEVGIFSIKEMLEGIVQAKKGFAHPILRIRFFAFFLFVFGWDYFAEFISVPLKKEFGMTTGGVGNFYAYMGLTYVIAVSFLIRPFTKRIESSKLLLFSMGASALALFLFLWIEDPCYFWIYIPAIMFLTALYWPVASTYVSDSVSEEGQGEILGVYGSIQALALVLSASLSGSLVGQSLYMPIYLGGGCMLLGWIVFCFGYFRQNVGASLREKPFESMDE